jgi:nicotinate phosphoribosyltransferase
LLTTCDAPIDVFGVGTDMATSADVPALDIAYKLVEYDHKPRMKLSAGKRSLPGRKQVFRQFENRRAVRDVIALRPENLRGVPLLQPVILGGRRVAHYDRSLKDIRRHREEALAALPERYLHLSKPAELRPVEISAEVTRLELSTRKGLERREIGPK